MTLFWIATAGLILLGLALLAPTLLRGARAGVVKHEAQNIAIARQRLHELEAERDRGELDPASFEQARQELERSLAGDLGVDGDAAPVQGGGKAALLVLAVLVPLLTVAVYQHVGAPEHLAVVGAGDPRQAQNPHGEGEMQQHSMEEALQSLVQRLQREPNDAEGWYMLGRSYMSLGRYRDAMGALEQLRTLTDGHPTALVLLADAVAMDQGGRMSGRPTELVLEALQKDPVNVTGLWLAGKAAEERGDFAAAVDFWEQALPGLAEQPQMQVELRALIASAQSRAGLPAPTAAVAVAAPVVADAASAQPAPAAAPADAAAAASLQVSVTLAPELAAKAQPGDVLYVFARAVSGPPMPLAAARLTAADLPAKVTLDDSMAMMPQMKLSSFPQVKVNARISRSGQPAAQSGDLESAAQVVEVGAGVSVALVIDRTVP